MICAITFTCTRHAREAAKLSKLLPVAWRRVWVIESAHEDYVAPFAEIAGAEIVCDDFNRGASLRGLDAVRGVIRSLSREDIWCDETEAVVKIDSNCALWDPASIVEPVVSGGFALCGIQRGQHAVSGACYAISRKAAKVLANMADAFVIEETINARGHEDVAISRMIARAGLPIFEHPQSRMNLYRHVRESAEQIFGHHF